MQVKVCGLRGCSLLRTYVNQYSNTLDLCCYNKPFKPQDMTQILKTKVCTFLLCPFQGNKSFSYFQ